MPDDQVVRDALVKIGEAEETNITINRHVPNGDGVDEVAVEVPEGEIDGVEEEIEAIADEVEEAETPEDIAEATGVDVDVSDVDPIVEEQEESETTVEDLSEDADDEQIARDVVREEGITSTDFVVFRSELLNRDVSADQVPALWELVKGEGLIGQGESPNASGERTEIDATDALTEDQEREAVFRHIFDGETQEAIGDDMGVSAGTISNVVQEFKHITGDEGERIERSILDEFGDVQEGGGTPVEEPGPEPEPEPETSPGEVEVIEGEEGLLAQLPSWALEPWDVAIDPMGAGDLFDTDVPCPDGEDDEVLYHFADPDEADQLVEHGEVTSQQTRDGGMFATVWARAADGTIYNALAGADGDFDEGILVGMHVCMEDGEPMGDEWERINENRWERGGGYLTDEVVAWRVAKDSAVPETAPKINDLITVEREIGATGTPSGGGGNPSEDDPSAVDHDTPSGEGFETDWDSGQTVLLSQSGCPACDQLKQDVEIQDALASGELEEVTPDHPDWNRIIAQTGVDKTPSIVAYDGMNFDAVDPGNA